MRILFLGDVVGRSGREAVITTLPRLRRDLAIEFAVVNAENASHGFGLGPDMADALLAAGADAITLGNHAWDRREIIRKTERWTYPIVPSFISQILIRGRSRREGNMNSALVG